MYLSAGLGTSRCPPEGAGGCSWGEECLDVPAYAVAPTTRTRINGRKRKEKTKKTKVHRIKFYKLKTHCAMKRSYMPIKVAKVNVIDNLKKKPLQMNLFSINFLLILINPSFHNICLLVRYCWNSGQWFYKQALWQRHSFDVTFYLSFSQASNTCNNASVGCPIRLKEIPRDLPKIALVSSIPPAALCSIQGHRIPSISKPFTVLTGCSHKFAWWLLESYEILIFCSMSGSPVQILSRWQQKAEVHTLSG